MEVRPFRGIRYNQKVVGDLATVICPPYDIITPEEQRFYYSRSDYNAIRLELPLEQPGDDDINNKYSRAAITLQQWLERGALQIDDLPAFYLHDQYFSHSGRKRMRRGLIARVRLEPWGNGIYPHEETSAKPREDRLQLMRACRVNPSPLLSLYQDPERKITSMLAEVSQVEPLMSLRAKRSNLLDSSEEHIIWAITDSSLVHDISLLLSTQPLYIADGHHRYETALVYQKERVQSELQISNSNAESCQLSADNYIMMELVEFSDPGLVIFPLHRLVRGIAPSNLAKLESQLGNFFILDFVPLPLIKSGADSLSHCEPFAFCHSRESGNPVINEAILGILGLEPQSLVILKRRQDVSIDAVMPNNRSQAYKEFSVSILNHVILERELGLAQDSSDIAYVVDVNEAYQQIKEGKYQLAFLLPPPQPEIVKAIAGVKDKLPRKSTYFYPKLPTGLVINPLL